MKIEGDLNSLHSPLISIITVVYNGVEHLERTIQSIIKQDCTNIEYIIVDGGSTDGTIDILKKHEDNINRWISEPDHGLYNAMNKGVTLAKGDYIMFLNSDDWLEDGALDRVGEIMSKNPGYDVYHGYFLIDDKNQKTRRGHGILPTSIPAYQPASFVRRTIFGDRKWFDEQYKIAADFKFFKSLQLAGHSFLKINALITKFSVGGASSDTYLRLKEMEQILEEFKYSKILTTILLLKMRIADGNSHSRDIKA
jgi:glycosyltransferase involved in cell wall biosynthesis